jgi:spore maturation protein SpmA
MQVDEIVKEVESVVDPIIDKLVNEVPRDHGEITQGEETSDIAKKSN